ncbi:MAG: hypothetical protein ACREOG_05440 [Gemmatimonadaceae bacterium]
MTRKPFLQFASLMLYWVAAACGDSPPARATEIIDPVIGTWELNVAKSTFPSPQAPTSQTVTFEPAANGGFTVTSETLSRDGSVARSTYTAKYDGKRYPISGSPNADSVSFARLDVRTVERFDTRGSAFVGSVTRIVSPDGKTLTVMNKPVNPQGRTVSSVLVYERR